MDIKEIESFWITEAKEALQVADHLMEKDDYSYALFFGHLAIEKLLKALHAVKQKDHAPPIHNLMRLAKLAGIAVPEDKIDALIEISAFNIEARYPDFKRAFRKKCNAEYAGKQITVIKEIFEWLQKEKT
ncbi:MAG: HEPN domain-containing protein [Candidatus Omnitrophica bacterium]|nr:HEPN domain-containing protein [Candidatus Omnitrophota bacterium]